MQGVKKYFDQTFGPKSPFDSFKHLQKEDRVSKINGPMARFATFDAAGEAIHKHNQKKIEGMRGTNAQDLIKAMSDAINKGARKDNKGNLENLDLRNAASNLKIVTTLLEKNEKNQKLTERQLMQLTLGLQQIAGVQEGILKKDPKFSTEGRLSEVLEKMRQDDKGQLLTNRNLNKLSQGKSTVKDKDDYKPNGFLSDSRSALYTITGPLGPLFQTVDDLVVGIRANKEEIMDGFKSIGRVFTGGFEKFTKATSAFKGLMSKFKSGSGDGGGGGLLDNLMDMLPGKKGRLGRRLKVAGGRAMQKGGGLLGKIFSAGKGVLGAGASVGAGLLSKVGGLGGLLKGAGLLGAGLDVGDGVSDLMDGKRQTDMPSGMDMLSPMKWGMYGGEKINQGVEHLTGGQDSVGTLIYDAVEKLSTKWDSASASFGKVFDQGAESLKTALQSGGAYVAAGAQKIEQLARDGIAKAKELAAPLIEKTKNTVGEGVTQARNFLTENVSGAARSVERSAANSTFDPKSILGQTTAGMGKIAGKLVMPSERVNDALSQASQATGVDKSYLMAMTRQESGFDPNAKAGTSSAKGLNQFIDGTWKGMVGKYGQQYGIGMNDQFDPQKNAMMGALFAKDNKESLSKNLGRDPTGGEMYMAHFMGAGGANKFLGAMNKDPNSSAADMMPKEAAANPNIYYKDKARTQPRSMREVYQHLDSKITPYQKAYANAESGGKTNSDYLVGSGEQQPSTLDRQKLPANDQNYGNEDRRSSQSDMQMPLSVGGATQKTGLSDIPMHVDDTGLLVANTSMFG